MRNLLRMQVVESQHDLLDDIDSLILSETLELLESVEEFTAFNKL